MDSAAPLGSIWGLLRASFGPKFVKNRTLKCIKNKIDFDRIFLTDFGRFWDPKWSQIGPKMGSKIDLNFNMRIFKNHWKTKGKSILLGFQGVEVGTENRPKIDPKRRCQRERVLASILAGFGTVLGSKLSPKMDPNLEKIELWKVSKKWSILWTIQRRFWGRLGGQVGPQDRPKTRPRGV